MKICASIRLTYANVFSKFLIFFFFFLTIINSFSQRNYNVTDSLKTALKNTNKTTDKINLLNRLAIEFNQSNLDSALFYANYSHKLAKISNDIKSMADSYYSLGISLRNMGVMDSTNYYLLKSLEFYERIKDYGNIIKLNVAIGEFYRANHSLDKATEFEKKAIFLSKRKKILKYLPAIYNRLGAIYFELSINNAVLDAVYKDTLIKTIFYVDSSIYWSDFLKTKEYNVSNNNILGACYQNLKDFDKANDFLIRALHEADVNNELVEKPMIYRNLSSNYLKLKQYEKAKEMANAGVSLSKKLGINSNLYSNYYALVLIAEQIKNEHMALEYLRKADSVKYLVNNEVSIAKTREFEAKYKTKEKELLIEHQNSEIIKKQQQFILTLIGFAFTVLIVIAGLFFTIRIRKINKLLEIKNKQIELASNELSKLTQFKDDLTGMIVHDLKNPLNTIINYSKIINQSEGFEVDNFKEKHKSIESSAFNMLNIVNNIIDLQKFEEARINLILTENVLQKTFENALQNVSLLIIQKNITVINNINKTVFVNYDNDLIERVLINFLTNAIKFSPNNETITINNEIINDIIKIKVSDNGPGIPTDMLLLLFNKFARAEIRKIGFSGSSGLGLAFSKLVVNAHAGEIGVDSISGKGSCFWFTLRFDPNSIIEEIKPIEKHKNIQGFSPEFLQNILSLTKILAKFNFYDTGEILKEVQNFKCEHSEYIQWKNQIENAVLFSNKEKYFELIS